MDGIKHKAVERIWLVPDASEGDLGYVWCDDPAPGAGMNPEDAVEYVRKDVHEARVAELEQERDQLAAHVERLQEVGDELRKPWDLNTMLGAETRRLVEKWDKTRAKTPATSLARRDAKVAYDAVYTATAIMNNLEASEYLVDLRQQASQLEKS